MVLDAAEVVRSFFSARPEGIAAVYLFGSVARGTARPDSDVDVAVLFQTPHRGRTPACRWIWRASLERALGRQIDLVMLNGAPVDLAHRVLRDGVLLLDPAHRQERRREPPRRSG
jgi:predicted nucleotidyltransferase